MIGWNIVVSDIFYCYLWFDKNVVIVIVIVLIIYGMVWLGIYIILNVVLKWMKG